MSDETKRDYVVRYWWWMGDEWHLGAEGHHTAKNDAYGRAAAVATQRQHDKITIHHGRKLVMKWFNGHLVNVNQVWR